MREEIVQDSLIKYLQERGWVLIRSGELKKQGVDLVLKHKKYRRYFFIETKGDLGSKVKSPGGSRSSSFNSAVGQIITRMHTNMRRMYKYGPKYGIGFPLSFKKKALNNLPYDVCDKLNLYVFFVKFSGEVEEYDYNKIKEFQTK